MFNFRLKIRLALWLAIFIVLAVFVYLKLAPNGHLVIERDYSRAPMLLGGRGFIGRLSPAERLATTTIDSKVYPEIIGDPAYFSWVAPRGFDTLKVSVEYEKPLQPLSLSLGLLMDKLIWQYQLKPLSQPAIDRLSDWELLKKDSLTLLQRHKNYSSVEQFLENLPENNKIALYNYNLNRDWQPANSASGKLFGAPYRLRGSYQFYFYSEGGLDIKFLLSDLNLNRDIDPVALILYDRTGSAVESVSLADDGVLGDSGERLRSRELRLSLANLKPGLYKAELRANDDVITEKLSGLPYYTAFINKIWAAADPESPKNLYPVKVWTDSQELRIKTSNPAALQEFYFGGRKAELKEAYSQLRLTASSSSWREINLSKSDVLLEGDGLFSFNKDSVFNPDIKRLTAYSDMSSIDYILADYQAPDCKGNTCLATAELDLRGAYHEDSIYSLMFSLPELAASSSDGLIIKKIRLEATGKSLWQKLKEKFKL
jgi:hypothetical protein